MGTPRWLHDWTVGVRVWIDRAGLTVLGQGRAELLEAIGERRSITAAAKAVGMSYRKAWMLVQEVNEAAGEPLVEAAVGGLQGGGAQLTELGRYALGVYRQLDKALTESGARELSGLVASPSGPAKGRCLHVAAAISFQEALGQILSAFALHRPTIRVRAVYGASNELADHLLAGAPGDAFVSAEAKEVDRLESAGRVRPGSRRTVALSGLAVIGAPGHPPLKRVAELRSSPLRRIALADPDCPLGRYSQAWLDGAGVYEEIRSQALVVDNSQAVFSAVASGAAEMGIAFTSAAIEARGCEILLRAPYAKIGVKYVAAALSGSGEPREVQELLAFMASPAAIRCLRRCGFRPPPAKGRRVASP